MRTRPSALVTGGGSGIGLATARALRARGVGVTLVGRRAAVLAAAAAELGDGGSRGGGSSGGGSSGGGSGGDVLVHVADLAEPDAPAAAVGAHVAHHGGIDVVLAAAGDYELTDAVDLDATTWDATLDVQLRGAVLTATAAAGHMTRAGRGRIVVLSSVNGFHSEPGSLAYSAAKAAIVSVARTLAVDLAPSGVVANAVAPGWVTSPMTEQYLATTTPEQLRRVNPLGRAGTVEEIADVVTWLALDAPTFLTGATLVVDGGQTAMAPMP